MIFKFFFGTMDRIMIHYFTPELFNLIEQKPPNVQVKSLWAQYFGMSLV